MIKKILLLFAAILFMTATIASAQTANRSGFTLDLQGGNITGYVYDICSSGIPDTHIYDRYMKGGAEAGIGIGYRVCTSIHWAYELRLTINENLWETTLLGLGAMTGFRYTSNDFGRGQSLYVAPNAGISVLPLIEDFGVYVPVEIGFGINITNRIALGVAATYRIVCGHYTFENFDSGYNHSVIKSNLVTSLRLSFRF